MSCTYYWWNHHYACRKSGKDVDEDTYYKYCRNYDYSDCPIYKGKLPSDNGNCYLTSACIAAKGLPDDCDELTTLRAFRDEYVAASKQGKEDIEHYYRVAPRVVAEINNKDNAKEVFTSIYSDLVLPCVYLIKAGALADAYNHYKEFSLMLESVYLKNKACT